MSSIKLEPSGNQQVLFSLFMKIRTYSKGDLLSVIQLWKDTGLVVAQNDPHKDIERKLKVDPGLFLVGELNGEIIGSVMGGYDGHRGWINYLAVKPSEQRKGYARELMHKVETLIQKKGCPKINLQVRNTNTEILKFYTAIGYADDNVVGLGKRIEHD